MIELLADPTLQVVLLGSALLGMGSGVLGGFTVLRRQSLLGDVLAHAALPGVALGYMVAGSREMGALLAGALATGVLAALAVQVLTRRSRVKSDAAMGATLSLTFAAGVVLLTYLQGRAGASQAGLDTFLFGQAAAILRGDVVWMAALTGVSLLVVALLWKELALVSFDPLFARTQGLPVGALELVLTTLTAIMIAVGLQVAGVVLMASMLIAPAAAARQWTRRLGPMLLLAAAFGAFGGAGGALLSSLQRGLATGPLIVILLSAVFVVSLLFAPERGLLPAVRRRREAGA